MRDATMAFGGGLALAVVASVTMLIVVIATTGDKSAAPSSVAELIDCPSGASVQASFQREANAFFVLGRLDSVDHGTLRVEAPNGDVEIGLTLDARVEGTFEAGDPIRVGGRVNAEGDLEATQVSSGCPSSNFVAEPTAARSPSDGDLVEAVTPASTPTPQPAASESGGDVPSGPQSAQPTAAPVPAAPGQPGSGLPPAVPTQPPAPAPTAEPTAPPSGPGVVREPREAGEHAESTPAPPDGAIGEVLEPASGGR